MISARQYYVQIAKPTVDDFLRNNKDLRLAMLACAVTLHVVDYVGQNRANNVKDGDKTVKALKNKARQQFAFEVVEGFALASKHCNLSSRPGFDSGEHMVAYHSFAGVMRAGESYLGDTIGGITVRWTKIGYANLTWALKETSKYFESEYPELDELEE